MDGAICALCDRVIVRGERAILLGIEKLLLHGVCYDEARNGFPDNAPRERRIEDLVRAARKGQGA